MTIWNYLKRLLTLIHGIYARSSTISWMKNFQAGKEGLMYAASKGLGVVIMEPLRGGYLVSNPPEIQKIWDSAETKRSPVEWSFRYLWDYPEINVVLSGMSNIEQVKNNIELAEKGFLIL